MSFDVLAVCTCVREIQEKCGFPLATPRHEPHSFVSYVLDDPEFGRMAYTVSILLMFSFVILLLMLRSIKRSSSTLQMETLLEAMRFREELDIQERQRRRLLKAKTKVTAWLTKTNGEFRGWKSSPALMQQRRTTSSTISEIPRVVVTEARDVREERSRTPCLSLMYDFAEEEQQRSLSSRCSFSLDLDNSSQLPIHSLSLDSS
ncbi:hypothetical protein V3C99_013529 [Haemonchus contortus]|uniref:C. briggsae CBR-MPS-1 protein n=2 Tax=Haemonchus contortus TaxID=6289 RepID=A0A7I4Y248_HAECO|nr:Protein MPS-1 [Haemonchus contortus]